MVAGLRPVRAGSGGLPLDSQRLRILLIVATAMLRRVCEQVWYILTYFMILAVAINSVLLVAKPNLKLFRDYDNLWSEVLYWPTILSAIVVITYLTFR
jgi:hypothetical protein